MIYMISDGRAIKIGRARDVNARRLALQTGNPLPLFWCAVFACQDVTSQWAEGRLHRACEPWRIQGEWFGLQPLTGALARIRDPGRYQPRDPLPDDRLALLCEIMHDHHPKTERVSLSETMISRILDRARAS